MIKQFHTPEGIIKRELTEKEIEDMALMGDGGCKIEYYGKLFNATKTIEEKIDIITKYLGLTSLKAKGEL